MRKINIILFGLFLMLNLKAMEKKEIDTLDILDKQAKDFFKAITGLEKDYLEEQIHKIENKNMNNFSNVEKNEILEKSESQKIEEKEDPEKKLFTNENEIAKITADFTKTKNLKDIRIKSMYSFNKKNFVVLKLENENIISSPDKESSFIIEGRYKVGDSILTHRIIDINTRTKTVKLYKKIDDEYGYYIYLSNYGISVSKLFKIKKKEKLNNINQGKKNYRIHKQNKKDCKYRVNVSKLNVRNNQHIESTILRVLEFNDSFTIEENQNNWLKLNTIFKNISGDIMDVSNQNNWVNFIDSNLIPNGKCF